VTSGKTTQASISDGYSLAELVIVIACAAILLTAAVPNMVRVQKEWALWGSARILETSLQWGRMHAISSNSPAIFVIDDASREFHWVDAASGDRYAGSVKHLPIGIRFIAIPGRSLRFYQHGNAAPAGTYTIAGEAGSYSVVVSPGGRIRLQRN
jgi:type II secretory pathway pseudopilin PulG